MSPDRPGREDGPSRLIILSSLDDTNKTEERNQPKKKSRVSFRPDKSRPFILDIPNTYHNKEIQNLMSVFVLLFRSVT